MFHSYELELNLLVDKWYINICGPVQSKVTQTPLPLYFAPIFMKDEHSAESNEKSTFQFYFSSYYWLYLQFTKNLPNKKKVVQKCYNLQ